MLKRLIWSFIALLSLLAVPALAGASGSSSGTLHTVNLHGRRDGLWTNSGGGFGLVFPGSKGIITGTASGTIGGKPTGQGVFYEKFTAITANKFKASGAYLFPTGSITFKEHTVKNGPNTYRIRATVTGGTGVYENATGKLTISGHAAPIPNEKDLSTNNVTGALNF